MTLETKLAERSARANFIQRKIDDLVNDIVESERFKKDKIKNWAEYERELIDLQHSPLKEYSEIANHIIKTLAGRGEDIDESYVYKCVPDDCHGAYDNSIFEEKKKWNNPLPNYKFTPLNQLTPAQVQDEVEQLDKELDRVNEEKRRKSERLQELLTKAKEEKIALTIPVKADSVRTAEGLAKETEGWLALGEHIETLQGVRDTYYEYPLSKEEDAELAAGIRAYNEIFKPYSDMKYSKSFPEWQQVQITNEHSGKHAAAVKHGTVLPDGSKRNLTREQVGDSAEEILSKSYNALMAIPIIGRLTQWHKKTIEPVVAQRKADLSPILSDKA